MAGYSGTPLAKKLGIKEGFAIKIIDAPAYYTELFTDMPASVNMKPRKGQQVNMIHAFITQASVLHKNIVAWKEMIVQDGMIWVSWPKKAAKVTTDVTEDVIRNAALENGLVDVKVCAIDDVWSGLKLVIPVKDRVR